MNKDTLIAIITNQDPKLAQAVSKMVDYIQDRWAAPHPSHRKIASQKITINAIRLLDHDQLDRLQDVLNHIAEDREYYMPERRYGMGR